MTLEIWDGFDIQEHQESGQETLPRTLGARRTGQRKESKPKLSDVLSLLPNARRTQLPRIIQQLVCSEALILVLGVRLCSECV